MILTTTIGAYPKPDFLTLPDWFKDERGTDAEYPTVKWEQAKLQMGEEYEAQIKIATEKIIKDQIINLKPSATLAINEESNKLKKEGKNEMKGQDYIHGNKLKIGTLLNE